MKRFLSGDKILLFYPHFKIEGKQELNSNYYLFELKDILLNHKNKTRNNHPVLVLKQYGNFRIHKKTDMNLLAWFLPLENHIWDRLLLIGFEDSF